MNEKQNTLRALREEPLLVTSWLCKFGWHTWVKWKDIDKPSSYRYQIRYCGHCNIVQERNTAR